VTWRAQNNNQFVVILKRVADKQLTSGLQRASAPKYRPKAHIFPFNQGALNLRNPTSNKKLKIKLKRISF
jgi:hypothetical protein